LPQHAVPLYCSKFLELNQSKQNKTKQVGLVNVPA
jgi:hypothetical protein